MPDIVLKDFRQNMQSNRPTTPRDINYPTVELRNAIIGIVHGIIDGYNGTRPRHTTFRYHVASHLDASVTDEEGVMMASDYMYVLVVDGEGVDNSRSFMADIREEIKRRVAEIMDISPDQLAVKYRVFHSSFG